MHLVEQYALSCGVKIDKPFIETSYFPIVPKKYITLHASSRIQSKTYDYYKAGFELSSDQINYLIIGNIIAFVVALVAIKSFIDFLSKKGFKIFGYYRIIFGVALLIIHFFIYKLTI